MIKQRHIISIVFILGIALLATDESVNADLEIPRQADISACGIFLNDPESTLKILGPPPAPIESSDDFPILEICNSSNTEVLTLVFHPGDVSNSFSEFRVRKISKKSANCIKTPELINHFITGKGIKLGMSRKELTEILGSDFTEDKKGNATTLSYRIDDFDNSSFLKKYNLPIYNGVYRFENDKLFEFEFGFEYP